MSTAAPPVDVKPSAAPTETLSDYARRWWSDVRGGELGSLPIIVGLVIIAIVFQLQNDRFLTAGNFVNLIVQTAPFATIAMGIVFVLLLGEIDLSIGYVSGVGGVLAAMLLTPDGNELPTPLVIVIVLGAGLAIGTLHGLIITKVGVPSFVVTLAGLLAWNGVVLLLIGSKRHGDPPERLRHRAGQQLHARRDGVDPRARLRRLYAGCSSSGVARAQGGLELEPIP